MIYDYTFKDRKGNEVSMQDYIDRDGNIVRRFEPTANMDKVKNAICDIL